MLAAALLALLDALLWRLPMFVAIAVGFSLLLRASRTPPRRFGLLGLALCLASVLVDAVLGMLPVLMIARGAAASLSQLGAVMRAAGFTSHLLLGAGLVLLCWGLSRPLRGAPDPA